MKLKQQPEDFQVEELTDMQPGVTGPFGFYQLKKCGLGTLEALQGICRRWKIESHRVSHGGMKDKHALTTQYLTIRGGPPRGLKQQHLSLEYLGRLPMPFGPQQLRGNRFQLALRDLPETAVEAGVRALEEARSDGVPNYFDDQRFGSVPPGRAFIARKLIEGDYESALKLALAEPYEYDRTSQKKEKRILRNHWADWATAQAKLPPGQARNLVTYLAGHPNDYRGAVARLRADLKSLYLAAYQSYLWNRLLARWLEQQCRPEQLVHIALRLGRVPLCRGLDDRQRALFHVQRLPLPSARLKLGSGDPLKPLMDAVLGEDGLELADMKLKHFREPFFSKGERAASFVPEKLAYRVEADERHAKKQKLNLTFDLPRGCYATMLVKRITMINE